MGAFKNLEEVKNHFQNDRFATSNGAEVVEFNDDLCVCEMKLDDRHKNAYGGVMGGAIYTLADFAFAVASNFGKEKATVSVVGSASFMSQPKGSVLYAKASLLKDGKSNCFYEVTITDDLERLIAVVSFNGAHI